MKRFLLKFCILFGIIYGLMGYYAFMVRPKISGDIGNIGKIPFGQEYEERMTLAYVDNVSHVRTLHVSDTITSSVITIGDSFSQFGVMGYNQFLADSLNITIENILRTPYSPEQAFIELVNHNKIPKGTIVIVETVERSMLLRLHDLDIRDTTLNTIRAEGEKKSLLLDETIIWVRTTLGIKQPIKTFRTSEDLFSHQTRHNKLYVYDSKWSCDGDIQFQGFVKNDQYMKDAYQNLYSLRKFADNHGIEMLYLIAADKYDVYEPFITDEHIKNPTLDFCPDEAWIINTKPFLQKEVYNGVKDVYMVNNTHWSPIGSQIVAGEVMHRIRAIKK